MLPLQYTWGLFALVLVYVWNQAPPGGPYEAPDRQLKVDCQNTRVNVLASVEYGSQMDDAFSLQMYTRSGGVTSNFKYYSQAQDELVSLDFSFSIAKIIEYVPTDTIPLYDPRKTHKAKIWRAREWGPFSYEVVNGVHHVYVTTLDEVLRLKAHFTTATRDYSGLQLDPNSVKLDIEVHDFPYSRNDTRLCLVAGIKSASKRSSFSSFTGLDFESSGAPFGRFSWVPEAKSGTDRKIAVGLKVKENGQATKQGRYHGDFYYSMITSSKELHPEVMIWDPELGLNYNPETGRPWTTVAASALLAILFVIGTIDTVKKVMSYMRPTYQELAALESPPSTDC